MGKVKLRNKNNNKTQHSSREKQPELLARFTAQLLSRLMAAQGLPRDVCSDHQALFVSFLTWASFSDVHLAVHNSSQAIIARLH